MRGSFNMLLCTILFVIFRAAAKQVSYGADRCEARRWSTTSLSKPRPTVSLDQELLLPPTHITTVHPSQPTSAVDDLRPPDDAVGSLSDHNDDVSLDAATERKTDRHHKRLDGGAIVVVSPDQRREASPSLVQGGGINFCGAVGMSCNERRKRGDSTEQYDLSTTSSSQYAEDGPALGRVKIIDEVTSGATSAYGQRYLYVGLAGLVAVFHSHLTIAL